MAYYRTGDQVNYDDAGGDLEARRRCQISGGLCKERRNGERQEGADYWGLISGSDRLWNGTGTGPGIGLSLVRR